MKVFTSLSVIISIIITAVCLWLFSSYVLTILWAWFIIPLFAVPALSIPSAAGLTLIFNYFNRGIHLKLDSMETEKEELIHTIIKQVAFPLGALFFGYIVLQFV